MKIPDLPTDNLYKFKSIILFLLTVGIGFLIGLSVEFTDKIYSDESFTLIQTSARQLMEVEEQISELDSLFIEDEKSMVLSDSVLISRIKLSDDKISNWKFELLKKRFELKLQIIHNDEISDDKIWLAEGYTFYLIVLLFLGLILFYQTMKSFDEWKKHLQVYHDIILMREAKVSEEKIEKHLENIENENKSKEEKIGFFKRLFSKKNIEEPKTK